METAKKFVQLIDTSTEVSIQEKTFLVHGRKKFPIHAECASKYSLVFRYLDDHHLPESDEPVSLLIWNNGQSVELGPCRIILDPNPKGYSGCLVFMRDVYDIQRLLRDNKVVKLQSAFHDLPHIFSRKKKVKPIFKSFVADLKYDLQVYKNLFDDLDSQYSDEPKKIRESVQHAIINTEGQQLIRFLDEKLEDLENAIAGFSRKEHQCHGFYFRKQLWDFLICCPLMARTNLKPRGYPGDSAMMRMIYSNDYQGESTFAKLVHKHAVGTPAAQSVRSRIKLISNILNEVYAEQCLSRDEKFKVFSVACGPALEMLDILKSPADCNKYHFALMDHDPVALAEASELIGGIENKVHRKITAEYLEGSVRTMLSPRKLQQRWGKFHFIYSLGLFDYLATPVAKAVLAKLYDLLKPGGEIVVGNFHVSSPSRYHMEYWGDWVLFHRTEKDLSNLLQENFMVKTRLFFDDTGSQMFLHLKKLTNVP